MKEKEYSEWVSKQGFDVLRHANCCKIAFNGGWESRQTEVDELQEKLDASEKTRSTLYEENVDLRDKNAELQKRVDELQTAFKQLIEMENESISFEHDLFDKGWNQSARQTIENIYKLTGLGEQALKGVFDHE